MQCSGGLFILRDHPRRCGENLDVARHFENGAGSPPQVRGKHLIAGILLDRIRITPAGAGKTIARNIRKVDTEDHPRRCGENSYAVMRFSSMLGSPPQVRGKPPSRTMRFGGRGITPAGAGKTIHSRRLDVEG